MTSPTATAEIERLVERFELAVHQNACARNSKVKLERDLIRAHVVRTRVELLAALRAAEAERDEAVALAGRLNGGAELQDLMKLNNKLLEIVRETPEAYSKWVEFNIARNAARAALSTSAKEGES